MPENLYSDLLRLSGLFFLLLTNAFFVAAEFAMVSVRRTRIAELVAHGEGGAEAVEKAMKQPDRVIATTQLGITVASLALGWFGEPALSDFLLPILNFFPSVVKSGVSHSLSAGISFAIVTFLTVVIGELAPKSIALQSPERISLLVAGPILWIGRAFNPFIIILNAAGRGLLHLLGVKPALSHEMVHSIEELRMLVTASTQGGMVEADESEMLHAVFDFGDLVVRQVMVPRTEITGVEADATLQDVITLTSRSTYTKFPVYEDNLDQILGVVHIKTLMIALLADDCKQCTARQFASEALFVPETLSVSALLHKFRDHHQHIAIVLDEFGGTAGMVTLEDLLEEIVGEVRGPFDISKPEIQTQSDGSILIDGLTLIEDVNNQLDLNLQDPDYDTIAGFMLGKLHRIPRINDTFETDSLRMRVEEMDGLRIARISLIRLPSPTPKT